MAEAKPITNNLLKGIMTDAMVYRGDCLDIDNTFFPGIYACTAEAMAGTLPNFPGTGAWNYGGLEVFKVRAPRICQRMTSESGDVAVRLWNGTWYPWKLMTSL